MGYTILDHTADIGLEATGPTMKDAFVQAAKGMFSIIVAAETIRLEKTFSVEIEADSPDDLLIGWLNRLLYYYDAEKVVLGDFEILSLEPTRLSARVSGEDLNPELHQVRTYIKAATYHQAAVVLSDKDKAYVKVIFDV